MSSQKSLGRPASVAFLPVALVKFGSLFGPVVEWSCELAASVGRGLTSAFGD
jgi:hypothetical protein